jgi:hypothetical protein
MPVLRGLKSQLRIAAQWGGGGAAGILQVGGVIFVQLPAGAIGGSVGFDPLGNGIEHCWVVVLRPFGVQPHGGGCGWSKTEPGERVDVFGNGVGLVDDDFNLIGAGDVCGERQFPALGAERDPVEVAAYRERTAGFQMCLLADGMQGVGERAEIVDGGLAAGDDGEFGFGLGDIGCESIGLEAADVFRDIIGVPSASGVAPRAMHRAAEGADKVGGPPGVHPFALKGVELFVDREFHAVKTVAPLIKRQNSFLLACSWLPSFEAGLSIILYCTDRRSSSTIRK